MADLALQISEIQPRLGELVQSHLSTGAFIGGPSISEFEAAFSSFTGSRHAIGVANGTDAIEIILQALDLPPKSVVLVPANSFVATAEAVLNTGHELRLVEVSEDFGFDPNDLVAKLSPEVRAVIAVHLYGLPQDLRWLVPLLEERGIYLIEDCAQAHGATLNSIHVGRFGVAGAFSFYPGKNLGAIGDAGGIITEDPVLADRARRIANHGRLSKFDHLVLGRNSRLDAIQASVLTLKLDKLNNWNQRRQQNAEAYRSGLQGLEEVRLPPEPIGNAVYHHFVIRTDLRNELRDYLNDHGIETGIHYPNSIDELPPYAQYADRPLWISRRLSKTMVSLPVGEHLSKAEIDTVCLRIRDFFSR